MVCLYRYYYAYVYTSHQLFAGMVMQLLQASCGLAVGASLVWRARTSNRQSCRPEPSATTIGVLHPGHMGASVIYNLVKCGHRVLWNADGRSEASAHRAHANGATDAGSLAALVVRSDVIISVCPPDRAVAVALAVASAQHPESNQVTPSSAPRLRLAGKTYVDANAIAPATAERIARIIEDAGGTFVDGGIVGGPAFPTARVRKGSSNSNGNTSKDSVPAPTTRLYLSAASSADAERVARLLPAEHSWLCVRVVRCGGVAGASALKVAYASWTKGSAALLLAVHAFATARGVHEDLIAEWILSQALPGGPLRRSARLGAVAPKAWRFEGEMHEGARAFGREGVCGKFHDAAAQVYGALAGLRGTEAAVMPSASELAALLLENTTANDNDNAAPNANATHNIDNIC